MTTITLIVDKSVFFVIILGLIFCVDNQERKFLIISTILVLSATFAAKTFLGVHRPPKIDQWNSFPSGHSIRISFLLGYIWLRALNKSNKLIFKSMWVIIALVMISRLYIGAHWWPDVLAGCVLGFGFIYLTHALYPISKKIAIKNLNALAIIVAIFYITTVYNKINNGYMAFFLGEKPNVSITQKMWLKNSNTIYPYINSRFNIPSDPLTIQLNTSIEEAKRILKKDGWQTDKYPSSWLDRLEKTIKNPDLKYLPTPSLLYNGKEAKIIAIKHQKGKMYLLSLWDSNYRANGKKILVGNSVEYQHIKDTQYKKIGVVALNNIKGYTVKYKSLVMPPLVLISNGQNHRIKLYYRS